MCGYFKHSLNVSPTLLVVFLYSFGICVVKFITYFCWKTILVQCLRVRVKAIATEFRLRSEKGSCKFASVSSEYREKGQVLWEPFLSRKGARDISKAIATTWDKYRQIVIPSGFNLEVGLLFNFLELSFNFNLRPKLKTPQKIYILFQVYCTKFKT